MNSHIWKVFTYELRRNLSRKGFLFTTFGIPLIGFLLFVGYQAISSSNNSQEDLAATILESDQFKPAYRIGYVDLSGAFSNVTTASTALFRYDTEDAAQAAMQSDAIDVYYVIAPDYVESGDVTLTMPRFSLAQANTDAIRQLVYQQFATELDPVLLQRLLEPAVSIREINLQRDASGQTESSFDADFTVVYIFAITLLMSQFLTNGYLMQGVIEEKETRLVEILISGMRPTELLAGKILALGLLGLIQVAVWIGAILLLSQAAGAGDTIAALAGFANLSLPPDKLLLFLIYFLLGYLFFAAAYGIVGAISTSMQEGPGYAVIFTLPAAFPLYFLSILIRQPDSPLSIGMSLFPITAPLTMVIRMTILTVPFWQIAVSIILLVLADIGMIWLAGRLFRVNSLLAGQTPKLRDLPKLLRG